MSQGNKGDRVWPGDRESTELGSSSRSHGRFGIGGHRGASTRRTYLKSLPLLAGIAGLGTGTAAAGASYPDVIPLPNGFQPEGIAVGRGPECFVGSLAGGAIFRGDLRTGVGDLLVDPGDTVAVGLAYDRRSGHLFVAGGPTGTAVVYDGTTGATAGAFDLTDSPTFVNDVVLTRQAAYFTDSYRPVLYRVPLGPAGQLPDPSAVEELGLGGEFTFVPGGFNANGIDASPSGAFLLLVNTTTGLLYRVDPSTGVTTEIDLEGDTVTAGDGILLDGTTLYVVRNQLNRIAVVALDSGATRGEVVGMITDPAFDVPTTLAEFGGHLYAVNARFGVGDPATASYSVVRVRK